MQSVYNKSEKADLQKPGFLPFSGASPEQGVELSLHHQHLHTVDGKRGIRTGDRLGLEKTAVSSQQKPSTCNANCSSYAPP